MGNISISSRVSLGRSIFSWRYYIFYIQGKEASPDYLYLNVQ